MRNALVIHTDDDEAWPLPLHADRMEESTESLRAYNHALEQVTLNVCIEAGFLGGQLRLYGPRGSEQVLPRQWSTFNTGSSPPVDCKRGVE